MEGSLIKDYRVERLLGFGGMATVYLAEHMLLQNKVAIKVLNKEYVHNENIRVRFLAEARNMARMNHVNIVKVIDLVDHDGIVAFVMEYVQGETLKEYIEKQQLISDQQLRTLFLQIIDAVEYVHQQGLIHRDIKPSNFMITPLGMIKLMDFGIAKNLDSTSVEYTVTHTTQQMGTPMYMSPEQVKSSKHVSSSTDIYSLGVLLWQLVSGKKPYDGNTLSAFEIQMKIVTEPLPETKTGWDSLIQKATEKDASARISISSFREYLKGSVANDTIVLEKEPIVESTIVEQMSDVVCPRCLGKGHVDQQDIIRLKRTLEWIPGTCAYCEGTGHVSKQYTQEVEVNKADLAYVIEEEYDFDEQEISKLLKAFSAFLSAEKFKSYYKTSIPDNKRNNFIQKFWDLGIRRSVVFHWYLDDTLFGKGDDGMAIVSDKERWFLLIAPFTAKPVCFELLHANKRIDSPSKHKKLVFINGRSGSTQQVIKNDDQVNSQNLVLYYHEGSSIYLKHVELDNFSNRHHRKLIDALSDCWLKFPGNPLAKRK